MIPADLVPLEDLGAPDRADGFPPAINVHGDDMLALGRGKGHGGALICLNAMRDIEKRGGKYLLNTPLTDIKTDKNGAVCEAIGINNETKEEIHVECKAVIICHGGMMDDPEMIKEHTGFTYTDYNASNDGNVTFNCFPNSGQTGDGHKLAWKLGGAVGAVSIEGHDMVPGPGIVASSPWIAYNQIRIVTEQPYLWVNRNGERFLDESLSNNHMAINRAIRNQTGRVSYMIFDDETRKHLEEEGVDYFYFVFPAEKLTDIKGQFKELIEVKKNKHVFMADTLQEISQKAGIDESQLIKTIEIYNQYCKDGHDDQFAKDPRFLRPVKQGPFYALRVFCGGYNTMGGIRINGKMQVIRDDGTAIQGLYAAGDSVLNELYGNPIIAGLGAAYFAMPLGFAAGDSASEFINQL
jgi:fumarate reductase flavoprotein subunit